MSETGNAEEKLAELGLELPAVAKPVAEYVPGVRVGDMVYVSGQGPIRGGKIVYVGRVGADVSVEEAYEAARIACLNCLAVVKSVAGSLDAIDRVVQVRGFVNSAPDFNDQPKVVNGVSDLLVQVLGDRGRHARAALGTSNLPSNIPVEVEMIVAVR
jgi:enamine deaminase RidA (YjgF/YER057c/UK114 family)